MHNTKILNEMFLRTASIKKLENTFKHLPVIGVNLTSGDSLLIWQLFYLPCKLASCSKVTETLQQQVI